MTRGFNEFTGDRQLRALRDELRGELDSCPDPSSQQAVDARTRLDLVEGAIEFRAGRQRVLERAASRPENIEQGSQPDADWRANRRQDDGSALPAHVRAARDEALTVLERHADQIDGPRQVELEKLLGTVEDDGATARYISACGDEHYRTAFAKALIYPLDAGRRMTNEEIAAMNRVDVVQRTFMGVGSGGTGGYAVPVVIDPTIISTKTPATNPLRQIAEAVGAVRQATAWQLQLVTSDGVSAAFSAEGTEVGDNSPTLGQSLIYTEKAQSFVGFSIESGQDIRGLEEQLLTMFAEAKDDLESVKFLSGAGHASNEPQGLITGTPAGSNVTATGVATFAIGDLYKLWEALAAKFQARAVFMASPVIWDKVRQFDTSGGSGVWQPGLAPGQPGQLLGRPAYVASGMPTVLTTGTKIMFLFDPRFFVIADRVGMSVEPLPLVLGAAHRPTGQRGAYAYWRTSSLVIARSDATVPAVRLLVTG